MSPEYLLTTVGGRTGHDCACVFKVWFRSVPDVIYGEVCAGEAGAAGGKPVSVRGKDGSVHAHVLTSFIR